MARILGTVLVSAMALLGGCGMTVTPPDGVGDPVEVFIADHGIHTSLVLPREDGTVVEFAYSRFSWAALDQDQWYRSLDAMIIPGDGAIGMREFPGPATRENVLHQFQLAGIEPSVKELYVVPVSGERCRQVRESIEARWTSHLCTAVDNGKRGLKFVCDPAKYSIGHNCNHEVAGWLRALGCKVEGATMVADVTVRMQKPAGAVEGGGGSAADVAHLHSPPVRARLSPTD